MKKIDVEEIMKEIKGNIKDKNYIKPKVKFQNFVYDEMDEKIIELNEQRFNLKNYQTELISLKENKEVQAWRFFQSNKFVGKIIVFIKKSIRKLTKFYIEPIVNDQNKLNENIYNMLLQVNSKFNEDEEKIVELQQRIIKLEKALSERKK